MVPRQRMEESYTMTDNRIDVSDLPPSGRLDALVEVLRKVLPDHFDWSVWASGNPTLESLTLASVDPECGSAACVAGTTACAFAGWEWLEVVPEYGDSCGYIAFALWAGIVGEYARHICLPEEDATHIGQPALDAAIARVREVADTYRARGQ